MYKYEEKKHYPGGSSKDASRKLKHISKKGLKDLTNKTSQIKSDISSLKSRVYSLRSENHAKAPEIEELEWMDDYLASKYHKEKESKVATKETKSPSGPVRERKAERSYKESGMAYSDLKKQFNMLMK
ncbi:unnamed protein product [Moneuplotes crassus]|uniref:Uncharacterized protein n=1 Tax=Euplotes crassus TaxID=5936 RepID=A0AAD1Y0S3_EUPCR|nr:unnamed protein product [Moneuplotes crassus]